MNALINTHLLAAASSRFSLLLLRSESRRLRFSPAGEPEPADRTDPSVLTSLRDSVLSSVCGGTSHCPAVRLTRRFSIRHLSTGTPFRRLSGGSGTAGIGIRVGTTAGTGSGGGGGGGARGVTWPAGGVGAGGTDAGDACPSLRSLELAGRPRGVVFLTRCEKSRMKVDFLLASLVLTPPASSFGGESESESEESEMAGTATAAAAAAGFGAAW